MLKTYLNAFTQSLATKKFVDVRLINIFPYFQIHCGGDIYISKTEYDNAKNKIYTYNKLDKKGSKYTGFVRYIVEVIVGVETLKKSSVTGRKCGRIKSAAKPKIDPTLIAAVIGKYSY